MVTTPTTAAILAARLAAGLTQKDAAALVHRARGSAWSDWERGVVPMPLAEWELFNLKATPGDANVDAGGRVRKSTTEGNA